jgi:hypothetical protein
VLLGHWTFDNTNTWVGQEGQLPLVATNLAGIPGWSSNAVLVDSASPALLAYNVVETNGNTNINCQTGSVLFYFRPHWSSTNQGGTGPNDYGRLIEMGSYSPAFTNGWWSLYLSPDGTQLSFGTATNGGGMTNLSATISLVSNTWCQIGLAYSPTGSVLFVDGQIVATGTGVTNCLNAGELTNGFRIGSDQDGNNQAGGAFDELETFDSPLSGIGTPVDTYWFGIPDYKADPDGTLGTWEMQYFGYLGLNPNADPDGDGNTLLSDYTYGIDPNVIQFSVLVTNHYVNINSAAVQLNVLDGVPSYMAVLVNDTNSADAVWQPFAPVMVFPLGSSDGDYDVLIGLRGLSSNSVQSWAQTTITLDTTPPVIVITNPATTTVTQPMIQLQGYSIEPLASLHYDVVNASGAVTNVEGFVIGQAVDTNTIEYTTSWFECYDIALTNGVNTITLRATDLAGNTTVTNFNFTLDYSGATNPPVFAVTWPQDGQQICGNQFTLQGLVDDNTVVITAQIMDESGNTNILAGLVERSGLVWVMNLPLAAGQNWLTVTATDAAGNTSTTNLTVSQSAVTVAMNPLVSGQFNQSSVNVTGTVSDASCQVTVNGVQATVYNDGSWTAAEVPVSATGTAIFDMEVYSAGGLSINAKARPAYEPDDPSGGALGDQIGSQPQPATVELTGFTGILNLEIYGVFFSWQTCYWSSATGGWYVDEYNYYSGDGTVLQHACVSSTLASGYRAINVQWKYVDVNLWDVENVQTTVSIVPSGQSATGAGHLYLVRACAAEYSNPAPFYDCFWPGVEPPWGQMSYPPEWLQIQDQALTDTGQTNVYGSDWGETLIEYSGNDPLNVTPKATQVYVNEDYTFDVEVREVEMQLAVDANRDGAITFDSADQTTSQNPYRFWINNNHDGYGNIWNLTSVDSVQEDLDPSTGNDATSNSISCTRDLEDYARLWINTQAINQDLQNGNLLLALQWENVTGNPQIRLFQAVETNGGTLYLTDTNMAQAQITGPYGTNIVDRSGQLVVTPGTPFIFPTNLWANLTGDPATNYLLFDAVNGGSGKLVLAIYKNDGVTKLQEGPPLYLDLEDITNMYERWTVGEGNGTAPANAAALLSDFQYTSASPEANQYILFVHGWNMSPTEKAAFAATAYKRLWWQGYKGRFGAFRWPTLYNFPSWSSQGLNVRNYDDSESNAWASATGLAGLLNSLNTQYPVQVYMFAHSMGNVVAGEALKLIGANQTVNTYIACQAAVSAHGYDPNSAQWESSGSTPDCYAHYYPTNGAPCYFNGVTSAGTRADFFNVNDWALNLWITDQQSKPDHGIVFPGYYYRTPSSRHSSGFYKTIGSTDIDLYFRANNYEILAFCVQSYSYALGATANVNGFTPQNLPDLWPPDPFQGNDYSTHPWHSAEFLFTSADQWNYWKALLVQFGLPTNK